MMAMDEVAFREEVREDFAQAVRAMDDAHRFFHGSDGWNNCELDPCHSVGVLLGDLALLYMASCLGEPA